MARFIEGENRRQTELLPACLLDYVSEDNPVRVVDVVINELDLRAIGFGARPRRGGLDTIPLPFPSCTSTRSGVDKNKADAGSPPRVHGSRMTTRLP